MTTTSMTILALPILPGKKEKWLKMMAWINSEPLKSQIDAIWLKAGLRRRILLQESSRGDFMIRCITGNHDRETLYAILLEVLELMNQQSDRQETVADFDRDVHGKEIGLPVNPPMVVYDSEESATDQLQ